MITSVRYTNEQQSEIAFERDGILHSAPYPNNRYRDEVQAWVDVGNTIAVYVPVAPQDKLAIIGPLGDLATIQQIINVLVAHGLAEDLTNG